MSNLDWKANWEESRRHYLDWWARKGLVITMWEHLRKDGPPHAPVAPPPPARDRAQYWFDPEWRAANIHYNLAHSSFKADILPVANTHLGPGSLAAILGSPLEGDEETIWIHPRPEDSDDIVFDEANPWWQLHLDLIRACKRRADSHYMVGCPDLIEGLDTLAGLRGTQSVLLDTVDRPEELARQLQAVNDIWFTVFDRIYAEINEDGAMAFCYFSIWGPGKVAKLQSDISLMISPDSFRRFVQPYIREQCRFWTIRSITWTAWAPFATWTRCSRSRNWTPSSGRRATASPRAATRVGTSCTSASAPAASRSCPRGWKWTNWRRCWTPSARKASTCSCTLRRNRILTPR
ncbi:MAG: hypothetical protein R2851_26955 [Caldilineaceae bacterium]